MLVPNLDWRPDLFADAAIAAIRAGMGGDDMDLEVWPEMHSTWARHEHREEALVSA